ncbi:MAG: SDR family NAD(P)-dependent oxidoreductase [Actinobacteria bacterium]|nr:SDR family NAD(P)-dependent oxidoreductase [Actinomycetota bacterium]
MRHLGGKVAVVTGAASGIGRGLARRFGAEGMSVVVADVEPAALDETAALIREAAGVEVLAVRTDVSDPDAVESLAARTYERFGAAHVVCNNAGVFQGGFLWERTEADWDWVFGVNVYGIIHGIRSFVPRMLEQGGDGHVVNTASIAGLVTSGYSGPYSVSKFAAVALSESLAHDLRASNASIGVSVLCPSAVNTRIGESTRNRTGPVPSEVDAPDAHFVEQALRDLTARGLEPDAVAGMVVDAIRAGQFYIPTNASYDEQIRSRFDDMVGRRLPRMVAYD